jgi:uncharacterized membrane protein YoaK (UPF0700 family)
VAVAAELVLVGAMAVAWLVVSGRPTPSEATAMLVLATVAMGIQSSVVRASPDRVPSTTYMTGSLTELVADIATTRRVGRHGRTLTALASLVAGALTMALLVRDAHLAAPFLVLGALAMSLGLLADHRRRSQDADDLGGAAPVPASGEHTPGRSPEDGG